MSEIVKVHVKSIQVHFNRPFPKDNACSAALLVAASVAALPTAPLNISPMPTQTQCIDQRDFNWMNMIVEEFKIIIPIAPFIRKAKYYLLPLSGLLRRLPFSCLLRSFLQFSPWPPQLMKHLQELMILSVHVR